MMKLLATRVCQNPTILENRLLLSFDSELWKNSDKRKKINELFFDLYNYTEPEHDDEHFQPKFDCSLNACNNFIPCIMGVMSDDYNDWICNGYEPNSNVYENSNLIHLGYEVIDTLFISCISHGISPISEKKLGLLNEFCLFYSKDIAYEYLKINEKEIPEHNWRLVSLFVEKSTYDFLSTIQKSVHSP